MANSGTLEEAYGRLEIDLNVAYKAISKLQSELNEQRTINNKLLEELFRLEHELADIKANMDL